MSWIDKILPSGVNKDESANRTSVPEGSVEEVREV